MAGIQFNPRSGRRTLVKAGLALGALRLAGPWIVSARAETPITIGMVDPETGTYAALGDNEISGARLALKEVNAKGGILGRQVQLNVQDSAANVSQAVQKANELIDQSRVDFLMGSVSSAVSEALNQTALLVEQNVLAATQIADRVYVLTDGRVVWSGESAAFIADEERVHALVGARVQARLVHSRSR